MGFWHTGYAEFHEEVGLGDFQTDVILPPQYSCDRCDAVFDSLDSLRTHRFEKHPIEQPVLMIRGSEIGLQPIHIKTPLAPSDVTFLSADEAVVNGKTISAADLGHALSQRTNGTVHVEFGSNTGRFPRVIHFRIVSHEDILGVEQCFLETAAAGRLDRRAIEQFIDTSKRFATAEAYCDGICEYLYGVLAKERSGEVDVRYEHYRDKFNRSVESLSDIHRPLAHQITSLVNFNFNLMSSAEHHAPNSRVGIASSRLRTWGRGRLQEAVDHASPRTACDRALTDADTEAIVEWACEDLTDLASHIGEIEEFVQKPLAEHDKSKCYIVLASVHLRQGDLDRGLVYARELYHLDNPQLSAQGLVALISSTKAL